jgi:phage tail-like protein
VQKETYPLPAYNFKVTVDGQTVGFSEVSGMSLENEKVTYRHGLSFWEGEQLASFRYPKHMPVTLKKGTVRKNSLFYGWLTSAAPRPVSISLCNSDGDPVVTWRVARAIPVKLQAPSFDANARDASIETLELMVIGISMEHS